MPFSYPPLPATDGLRILTLEPADSSVTGGSFGDFYLRGSLAAVPFSSKPKYIALSYTWADPDEAHASLPVPLPSWKPPAAENVASGDGDGDDHQTAATTASSNKGTVIILNGEPFPIGHNLTLALLHIRSDTEPLHIWVDQICIDQSSIPERNAQVALMAFIFTRASAVVAWLGVADTWPPADMGMAEYMRIKWASGRGKQLAKLVQSSLGPAARQGKGKAAAVQWKPQFSDSSTGVSFMRNNPYWQRVWVIQEVCLPRTVVFLHGGYLWSQEQIRASLTIGGSAGRVAENALAMETLLSTRDERFSETMSLEVLIEKFADCGCADLRDKVYGLLGLANDVESSAATTTAGVQAGKVGRGMITIDYTRNFWEIFCDVVSFMASWSKPQFNPCLSCPDQTEEERSVRIVRFAGVLQNSFQGKVQEDVASPSPNTTKEKIMAKGYIAGTIQRIGPQYSKFVGSYAEEQAWISSWHDHYSSGDDLAKLREMEDLYAAKIIDYTERDLAHIRGIASSAATVWHATRYEGDLAFHESEDATVMEDLEEPVRFLGTDYSLGLAPPSAAPGDLIIRFWNCDAAIVVRREGSVTFTLVGRADIAEPWNRKVGPDVVGRDYLAIHWDERAEVHDCSQFDVASDKAVYVRMNYETLQKITADIST